MTFLLLFPVVFYTASLLMAIRYLNRRREVSATLWTPNNQPWEEQYRASCEWKRFADATDGDWNTCPTWQAMFVKPWQPSVWRKLNPDLYREKT